MALSHPCLEHIRLKIQGGSQDRTHLHHGQPLVASGRVNAGSPGAGRAKLRLSRGFPLGFARQRQPPKNFRSIILSIHCGTVPLEWRKQPKSVQRQLLPTRVDPSIENESDWEEKGTQHLTCPLTPLSLMEEGIQTERVPKQSLDRLHSSSALKADGSYRWGWRSSTITRTSTRTIGGRKDPNI
jgi:hypothetical protein